MKATFIELISAASITATLSLLGINSLPASAQATNKDLANSDLTPFALVSQAQSGRLKFQGISGNGALNTQYRLHQVTAESLVQAGINAHLIPAGTLQNPDYINAVDSQMQHRINN